MNISKYQITFLRHVSTDIKVDMRTSWRQHYFEGFSQYEISSFLHSIGDDKVYLLIPKFSTSQSLLQPSLELSEPFLVDNNSNPILITKFLLDQWKGSGFNKKPDTRIILSFKWKRVWFYDK